MSLTDAIRILNEKVPPVLSEVKPGEPLETPTGMLFPLGFRVPSENSYVHSVGEELPEGDQIENDLSPANDHPAIIVECWTPSGIHRLVEVESVQQGMFVQRMNPEPKRVICSDCAHATVTSGIAQCAAGVDSGITAGGWWATDRHLCSEFDDINP